MGYRIIIIDDEKEISSGFAQFFPWAKLGFSVVKQFTNARAALDFLSATSVDVIVSDIVMPEMSGIDLARAVSQMKLQPRPLIVLFTAYNEFTYAQQAIEYGCSNYILKSSGYDELIASFSKLKKKLDESHNVVAEKKSHNKDKIIRMIQEYVLANPATANLEEAAAVVYLSPSYTSRYYKQKTGISFMDYVMQNRMELAAEMLLDIRYKIYDISALIGYNNPYNFTRSFKRYYGFTPRDYRLKKLGMILPDDEEGMV